MLLKHKSLLCYADEIGVPLQSVERSGKSFIVRAVTQADAEETVTAHIAAKAEAAADEPVLPL